MGDDYDRFAARFSRRYSRARPRCTCPSLCYFATPGSNRPGFEAIGAVPEHPVQLGGAPEGPVHLVADGHAAPHLANQRLQQKGLPS
jgi:hypothetical protein